MLTQMLTIDFTRYTTATLTLWNQSAKSEARASWLDVNNCTALRAELDGRTK